MAENPLLPHRRLKELHALMLRCRELERKQRSRSKLPQPAREALLAATSMHLLPGDLLYSEPEDNVALQLAPKLKRKSASIYTPATAGAPQVALAAATARGLQAGGEGLVLAYIHSGVSESGWEKVLAWAHDNQLPLVLACTDFFDGRAPSRRAPGKGTTVLDFNAMARLSRRTKLPVLTVDGEDAVAVYRVMQESVIRARMGGGPAVLWAFMNPAKLTRSQLPLARLESYLAVRNIKLSR